MSNTDRFSMLERWAIGMENLEQYYEGKYGPPATPAQLPAITTYDGMLEAIADGMERAKRNINKKSPTYHSDSSAYVKTVPSGDVHYASLEQIGGRTLVWNQLANACNQGSISVQIVSDGNGIFHINGTTTSVQYHKLTPTTTSVNGHKYYVSMTANTTLNDNDIFVYNDNHGVKINNVDSVIQTATADSNFFIRLNTGVAFSDVTITVQIHDLTLMYGAGNEPSTVAEFTAQFPASYPYNAGTLLSAGVTEVVSKKADTTTLATYPIPAEVRALSGYGWSCPSHYNYIDFEAKKFVQEVGSRAYASGDESDSTVITDGTTTYYPLNPAIETDISAYLADDNLIEVEAGGTLTFPNSNGDDYRIGVPSAETFVVGEP